jgi:hypothetical protein
MRTRVKEKWLERLRSGEVEQARGALRVVDSDGSESFCCLGVLCEIAVEEGVIQRTNKMDPDEDVGMAYYDPAVDTKDDSPTAPSPYFGTVLPPSVIEWAELPDNNPKVQIDDKVEGRHASTLANLNDNGVGEVTIHKAAWTFEQIADAIEKNL